MDKAQQIDERVNQFNQTSINASKVASKGLVLGGQFVAHDKVIKDAISGKLSSKNSFHIRLTLLRLPRFIIFLSIFKSSFYNFHSSICCNTCI